MQQAATDDTIAWPPRGDGLRRWENQRMLSSYYYNLYLLPLTAVDKVKEDVVATHMLISEMNDESGDSVPLVRMIDLTPCDLKSSIA